MMPSERDLPAVGDEKVTEHPVGELSPPQLSLLLSPDRLGRDKSDIQNRS